MVDHEHQHKITRLSNGVTMPLLGLGVYDMHGDDARRATLAALEIGYRLLDTAAVYGNEKEIGKAITESGLKREDVFVTTKVANSDQGYESTLNAYEVSRKKLGLDYIDLYLVHWPIRGKRKDTWKALEKLYSEKRVRAIGVANYLIPFLEELSTYANEVPVLNQVEFSPYLYLEHLLNYCREKNIQLQSYTPLLRGKRFKDPKLIKMAAKYEKTPAQLILRWNLQLGVSTIPKSSNPARLKENFDLFDFSISAEDMQVISGFNEDYRVVDDPMGYF